MSTKSQRAKANALRYGRTTIRVGQKLSWIAKEDKNGWALGLATNSKTIWLRNTRFPSLFEIVRTLEANINDIGLN